MCVFYPTTKREAQEDVANMKNIVLLCEKKIFLFTTIQEPLQSLIKMVYSAMTTITFQKQPIR